MEVASLCSSGTKCCCLTHSAFWPESFFALKKLMRNHMGLSQVYQGACLEPWTMLGSMLLNTSLMRQNAIVSDLQSTLPLRFHPCQSTRLSACTQITCKCALLNSVLLEARRQCLSHLLDSTLSAACWRRRTALTLSCQRCYGFLSSLYNVRVDLARSQ